jgi:hypothetical protein
MVVLHALSRKSCEEGVCHDAVSCGVGVNVSGDANPGPLAEALDVERQAAWLDGRVVVREGLVDLRDRISERAVDALENAVEAVAVRLFLKGSQVKRS